jgi:hypothetical protein
MLQVNLVQPWSKRCPSCGRRQVRGLLCQGCNKGIGLLRDDPAIVERAAAYLKGHR